MEKKLTLLEHLSELRLRIIKSLLAIIVVSCILYNFVDEIWFYLTKPVGKLIFISPQEAFLVNLKIAFLGGVFFSSPFVLYQAWKFISEGLRPQEKKYALIFGCFSFILFILGVIFGFGVLVPIGMKFLLNFASGIVKPMITMSNYISFITVLTLISGLIFQLPLGMLFATKVGIVNPQILATRRREAIVVIFILAAILTPPDVITQILFALPLIILYEAGLILSRIAYKPI
jgi:sec-independent protein translocase protein TatC